MQNTVVRNTLALFGFLVLVGLAVWAAWAFYPGRADDSGTTVATDFPQRLTAPGGVSFSYGGDWGVAITPNQILVDSYIPPCDSNFDYCFYRTGDAYEGTNFESAGLRVKQRVDLATKTLCLSSLPVGYSGLTPQMGAGADYATSVFGSLSDAAAGHYATGALYRLWFDSTCFEFETRIGESQYANYPAGSIEKFSDADRTELFSELESLLHSITIVSSGAKPQFPAL